jgi:hypothetical protein
VPVFEAVLLKLQKDEIMNLKIANAIAAGLLVLAGTGILNASAIPALVNFDPPAVSQGPSIYVAVPAPQTIVTTPATFSGGVALGFATFFPAISFATPPNVYGSADFGNHLSNVLTVAINPAFTTTEARRSTSLTLSMPSMARALSPTRR